MPFEGRSVFFRAAELVDFVIGELGLAAEDLLELVGPSLLSMSI
jgi:hypothetical protein